MSGGSLDYAYQKVEDAAEAIESRSKKLIHRAFANHLRKVAKALHDIEWVLSADYSDGDDQESIMMCLSPGQLLQEAIDSGLTAIAEINSEIERAKGLLNK